MKITACDTLLRYLRFLRKIFFSFFKEKRETNSIRKSHKSDITDIHRWRPHDFAVRTFSHDPSHDDLIMFHNVYRCRGTASMVSMVIDPID